MTKQSEGRQSGLNDGYQILDHENNENGKKNKGKQIKSWRILQAEEQKIRRRRHL